MRKSQSQINFSSSYDEEKKKRIHLRRFGSSNRLADDIPTPPPLPPLPPSPWFPLRRASTPSPPPSPTAPPRPPPPPSPTAPPRPPPPPSPTAPPRPPPPPPKRTTKLPLYIMTKTPSLGNNLVEISSLRFRPLMEARAEASVESANMAIDSVINALKDNDGFEVSESVLNILAYIVSVAAGDAAFAYPRIFPLVMRTVTDCMIKAAAVASSSRSVGGEDAAAASSSRSVGGVDAAALGVDADAPDVDAAALGVDAASLGVDADALDVDAAASSSMDAAALGVDAAALGVDADAPGVGADAPSVEAVSEATAAVAAAAMSLYRAATVLAAAATSDDTENVVIAAKAAVSAAAAAVAAADPKMYEEMGLGIVGGYTVCDDIPGTTGMKAAIRTLLCGLEIESPHYGKLISLAFMCTIGFATSFSVFLGKTLSKTQYDQDERKVIIMFMTLLGTFVPYLVLICLRHISPTTEAGQHLWFVCSNIIWFCTNQISHGGVAGSVAYAFVAMSMILTARLVDQKDEMTIVKSMANVFISSFFCLLSMWIGHLRNLTPENHTEFLPEVVIPQLISYFCVFVVAGFFRRHTFGSSWSAAREAMNVLASYSDSMFPFFGGNTGADAAAGDPAVELPV